VSPLAPLASAAEYLPLRPQDTLLHRLVREHYKTFVAYTEATYATPLPRYVTDAFERYLACGDFSPGFVRCHCDACRHDVLVAFWCKQRGLCPSWGPPASWWCSGDLLRDARGGGEEGHLGAAAAGAGDDVAEDSPIADLVFGAADGDEEAAARVRAAGGGGAGRGSSAGFGRRRQCGVRDNMPGGRLGMGRASRSGKLEG
jgi:hypothetical protein